MGHKTADKVSTRLPSHLEFDWERSSFRLLAEFTSLWPCGQVPQPLAGYRLKADLRSWSFPTVSGVTHHSLTHELLQHGHSLHQTSKKSFLLPSAKMESCIIHMMSFIAFPIVSCLEASHRYQGVPSTLNKG